MMVPPAVKWKDGPPKCDCCMWWEPTRDDYGRLWGKCHEMWQHDGAGLIARIVSTDEDAMVETRNCFGCVRYVEGEYQET